MKICQYVVKKGQNEGLRCLYPCQNNGTLGSDKYCFICLKKPSIKHELEIPNGTKGCSVGQKGTIGPKGYSPKTITVLNEKENFFKTYIADQILLLKYKICKDLKCDKSDFDLYDKSGRRKLYKIKGETIIFKYTKEYKLRKLQEKLDDETIIQIVYDYLQVSESVDPLELLIIMQESDINYEELRRNFYMKVYRKLLPQVDIKTLNKFLFINTDLDKLMEHIKLHPEGPKEYITEERMTSNCFQDD